LSEKLTKLEWQDKIKMGYFQKTNQIVGNEIWFSPSPEHLRLSWKGMEVCKEIGMTLHTFHVHAEKWTGGTLLGLSRMKELYYMDTKKQNKSSKDEGWLFMLVNEEYATLLGFLDNDLDQFARTFLQS